MQDEGGYLMMKISALLNIWDKESTFREKCKSHSRRKHRL
jgi:hypothetical protein